MSGRGTPVVVRISPWTPQNFDLDNLEEVDEDPPPPEE
jgi:hypothetical protein